MTKRVVICGGGPSRHDALSMMNDDSHLWVVGVACPEYHGHAHTIFEMHKYEVFKKLAQYKYVGDLKKAKCRLVMIEAHESFPQAVAYPIEEITQKYGTYLTSTISYMIALAIHEGYKEIVLVGVELDKEIYKEQKGSIEFFLGVAWGSGIVVMMPTTLPFLKVKELYGYGTAT